MGVEAHCTCSCSPEFVWAVDGTKLAQAFGFCVWGCVLGMGTGERKP